MNSMAATQSGNLNLLPVTEITNQVHGALDDGANSELYEGRLNISR